MGKLGGMALAVWLVLAGSPSFAGTQLPNAEQTFLDQNGDPLGAGKVYFYIPNTLTPKTTWKDAGQSMANTNPVVLDSSGRAVIYGTGTYRQVVKDVFGNTVWDQLTYGFGSGVEAINSAITSSTTIDTCSGVFPVSVSAVTTITLPSSPGPGDSCSFVDVGNNTALFPVTFSFGGKSLPSGAGNFVLANNGASFGLLWLGTPGNWVIQ